MNEQQNEAVSRSWPEDHAHENGNYQNKCMSCSLHFIGHKRRYHCRACSTPDSIKSELAAKEAELAEAKSQYQAEHSLVLTCYDQLRGERDKIETLLRADKEHAHGVRGIIEERDSLRAQLARAGNKWDELLERLDKRDEQLATARTALENLRYMANAKAKPDCPLVQFIDTALAQIAPAGGGEKP